jgi:hypothetical protein
MQKGGAMTDREIRHEGNDAKLRQLREGHATEGDRRYRALLRNRQLRKVPVTAEQLAFCELVEAVLVKGKK